MPPLRWNSPSIINALKARAPFTTSNFCGWTDVIEGDSLGYLSGQVRQDYYQALVDGRVTYAVYSYETPIAWVLDGREVVIPEIRFSGTTSKHQALVRGYLTPTPSASGSFTVTWDFEGKTFDSLCDTEEDRDARILELVKSGAQNVRIEA